MNARGVSSYWCHACNGFFALSARDSLVCPTCGQGFIEEIRDRVPIFPITNPVDDEILAARSNPPNEREIQEASDQVYGRMFRQDTAVQNGAMQYIVGNGRETQPRILSANSGDYFMGSGLEQLIQQLSETDRSGPPPAPTASVNAMPTIKINSRHLANHSQCPVCQERFEIGGEAREMPCCHIYHSECIVPWLAQHNSCPVCRHGLPSEVPRTAAAESSYRASNDGLCPGPSSAPGGRTLLRGSQNATVFSIRIDPTGQNRPVYVAVGRTTNVTTNDNNISETSDNNGAARTPNSGELSERRRNLLSYLWPFRLSSPNARRPRCARNVNGSHSNSNSIDEYRRRPDFLYGIKIYFAITFCIYVLTRLWFYQGF